MATEIPVRNETLPELLTLRQLSAYLGVPVSTLYLWRTNRQGPPGFRVGKGVRYRLEDVLAWLEERRLEGGAGP